MSTSVPSADPIARRTPASSVTTRETALVDHVGYGEAGQRTERVRREPVFDLLFDKIGKAHPDVFNLLPQVLDGGAPPDEQGRTVDNEVIVITSNIGSELLASRWCAQIHRRSGG
jgi:ATP-dependent Clp protease ATP-binding subunit ClpA